MNLICPLFLVVSILLCEAQTTKDPCPKDMELWTYGLGDFIVENAHRIASQSWPFHVEAKMGHVLASEDRLTQIQRHNDSLWAYLESMGHRHPKALYQMDFEREKAHMAIISDIIGKDGKIRFLINILLSDIYSVELKKADKYTYGLEWISLNEGNPLLQFACTFDVVKRTKKALKAFASLDELGFNDNPLLTSPEVFFLTSYLEDKPESSEISNKKFLFVNGVSGEKNGSKSDYFRKVRKGIKKYRKVDTKFYTLSPSNKARNIEFDFVLIYGKLEH